MPVPTADLASACARDWDAIVIGAGPAGAVAALQAARCGASVLLVERKPFPRSKVCGGCLNAATLVMLDRLGLAEQIHELGGTSVDEFHVRCGGRDLILALPTGLAVSRGLLDAAVVKAAVIAGVAFLPETTARVGDLTGDGKVEFRQVILRGVKEYDHHVRARIVLVADGLGHASLDDHPEFASRVQPGSRIGLGCLLPTAPACFRPGAIHMAVGRSGYAGLVQVEEQRLNFAAAVDPKFVREQRSPAAAVAAILNEAGMPAVEGLHEASWQGTLPLTRRSLRLAGRRVLLLGDAAGYVEPFTGEGLAWAVSAAVEATPFVRHSQGAWDQRLEDDWSRQLRRLVTQRQRWCRGLAAVLRFPALSRWMLMAMAAAPALARPIIGRLNSIPNISPGIAR